jgi:hypothetical protein
MPDRSPRILSNYLDRDTVFGRLVSSETEVDGRVLVRQLQIRSRKPDCPEAHAGDVTLALGSTQTMLIASPCGLTSTVEIRYDLATHVDHLALPVYPDTSDRIVA